MKLSSHISSFTLEPFTMAARPARSISDSVVMGMSPAQDTVRAVEEKERENVCVCVCVCVEKKEERGKKKKSLLKELTLLLLLSLSLLLSLLS
jgi:hypothetical protein